MEHKQTVYMETKQFYTYRLYNEDEGQSDNACICVCTWAYVCICMYMYAGGCMCVTSLRWQGKSHEVINWARPHLRFAIASSYGEMEKRSSAKDWPQGGWKIQQLSILPECGHVFAIMFWHARHPRSQRHNSLSAATATCCSLKPANIVPSEPS